MFRLLTVFVLLLLCAGAIAQNIPNPPLPGLDMVSIEAPNVEVGVILDKYEELHARDPIPRRLVRDATVLVAGTISIVVRNVTREDALKIIEMSLIMNGVSLVPSEDPSIWKVGGTGKNAMSLGVPIISDAALLPKNEQIITYLMKLEYADPTDAATVLSLYLQKGNAPYTTIVPLPKSQALLITENTPIIRSLIRIVREIDLKPAEVESYFIALERADAKEVLDKLKELLQPTTGPGATGAPGARPGSVVPRPARPATTPEGLPLPTNIAVEATGPNGIEITGSVSPTEDSLLVGTAKINADIRTNRIHVVTRKVNMEPGKDGRPSFLQRLIKEYDQDVKFAEPVKRPLKWIFASDVIDVIVKALSDPGAKADTTTQTGDVGGQRRTPGGTVSRGGGGNDLFGGGQNSQFGGGSSSINSNVRDTLETQPRDTRSVAVKIGTTTQIIADNRANSVIILGNKEVKAKVFRILDELDVEPPQVMLHTVVGELTLSNNKQVSVDYIIRHGGNLSTGTTTTDPTTPGTPGTPGTGTGTTTGGIINFSGAVPGLIFNNLINQNSIRQISTTGSGGLSGFIAVGNSLDIIVNALESTNRFHVTSRPSIQASNNEVASIVSGTQIAIPTSIQSSLNTINQSNGIVSNSQIQYKDVVIKLEIRPLINSNKQVTLDIVQRVDELSGSTRIDNNDIPTIATRTLTTHVSVPNQAVLILGGLIRQSETNNKGGIPYLNRIPLIGPLFGSTKKEKTRNELVVLIHPEVTTTADGPVKLREREFEYLNIPPDLESTLYPPGIRAKAAPEVLMRTPPPPSLREKELAPSFKK